MIRGIETTVGALLTNGALVRALLERSLRARYRGSVLGFLWTFLNPLMLMAVYSLVFSFYMRIDVENYPLFLLAGLLPWIWFSSALSEAAMSIVGGGPLVTKSIFPAEVLPTVTVLNHGVNYLFAVPVLVMAAALCGVFPDPLLVFVVFPIVFLLQGLFTLGWSLALAALNVHYRDVQHILSNLLLLWFFLCPIVYPAAHVPERFQPILRLNPMGVFAEVYQGIFVSLQAPSWGSMALLTAHAVVSFVVGAVIFASYRDSFAELV